MADKPRTAFHQDYIARIRYSNTLPPPPCPPKLLEIPLEAQYTSAGFASRLVREQPLNIEADSELGMPIDLVGIPGVFEGDESAIQAMEKPPVLSPADRALMRAPNALGKPVSGASGISFLRRTEYTTSYTTGGSKFESSNSSNTMRVKGKRRRPVDMSKDDPINIAKHIQKGFDLAYPADAYTGPDTVEDLRSAQISPEEKQAWVKPKHPTKPGVHLIDSYPLLPDWDALPDGGAYMIFKFKGAPLKDTDAYDERLDVGLLRPLGPSVEDHERYQSELAAYEEDPTRPVPLPRSHFEFYLPADTSKEKVRGIKRNFATYDPENADEIPFETGVDVEGRPRKQFKFEMVRTYETDALTGNPNGPFEDVVAIALHDDNDPNKMRSTKLQKAAYFYPISHRTVIKPRRGEKEMVEEQPRVDAIETVTRDPTEEEAARREATRKQYEGTGTEGGES